MKKVVLSLLIVFLFNGLFAQIKYKPVVKAVFLSPKNETFDESRFPDIEFYYVKKIKYKKPEGMLENYEAGQALAFDKNGVLISYSNSVGSDMDYWPDGGNFILPKRGEYTNLKNLSKEYVKKGKVMKEGKKFKGKDPQKLSSKYISFKLPDFTLYDSKDKEVSFNDLTEGNPLTLIVFVYLDPDSDGQKGQESGAEKTGKQYMKDVQGTLNFEKDLSDLKKIEEFVFGKNMRL